MKILLYFLGVGIALGLAWWMYSTFGGLHPVGQVTSFEECVAAGNPVMESYPRQCRSADGLLFVESIPRGDTTTDGMMANGCAVAGCSGQLCVSASEAADVVTTCEFRPEYACYREAPCEPQPDGQCGWTQTPELLRCLAAPPAAE